MIPRIHVQKKQIYEDRRQISGCTGNLSWGEEGGNEERRKRGMTANVYVWGFFWEMIKIGCGDVCTILRIH